MGKSADIRGAVEAELGFDPLIDDADITVRNINGDWRTVRVPGGVEATARDLPSTIRAAT